jgi:hypothetical protein
LARVLRGVDVYYGVVVAARLFMSAHLAEPIPSFDGLLCLHASALVTTPGFV